MSAFCAKPAPRPSPLYFVEHEFGRSLSRNLGRAFLETDRDTNCRAAIIRCIRTKEINPVKILQIIEPCDDFPRGDIVDVTAELIAAAEHSEPAEVVEFRKMLADFAADHERDSRKHGVA